MSEERDEVARLQGMVNGLAGRLAAASLVIASCAARGLLCGRCAKCGGEVKP